MKDLNPEEMKPIPEGSHRCFYCRQIFELKNEMRVPHPTQLSKRTEYGSLHCPFCGSQTGIYKRKVN